MIALSQGANQIVNFFSCSVSFSCLAYLPVTSKLSKGYVVYGNLGLSRIIQSFTFSRTKPNWFDFRIFSQNKESKVSKVVRIFSEKGTNLTRQTHIWKFEILEILLWNRFYSAIFPLDWCGKFFWTEKILNHCNFTDIVWEIKDFKFSDVSLGVIFVLFSENLACKILSNQTLWEEEGNLARV